jgi:bla regulator protein blaR1
MSNAENWMIEYFVNSLWMVPLVFAAAWVAVGMVKSFGPRAEHRVWVLALLLEILLPAVQVRLIEVLRAMSALAFWSWGTKAGKGNVSITVSAVARAHEGLHLPHGLLMAIAIVYVCSILYFAARLAWGLSKTYAIERDAEPSELEDTIAARWEWHLRNAGVRDAALLLSEKTRGPATLGIRRGVLMVPPGFFEGMAESELDAVMAHECAHMRRHDFTKNVLYSAITLPVAYHPLLWMTFSKLTESREMVCDAIAAETIAGPERYARSLLRLASLFVQSEPAGTFHAIGIFDANSLERRVMNLMRQKQPTGWALRTTMLAVCVAIGTVTCASALALRMNVSAEKNQKTADRTVKVDPGVIASNAIYQKNPEYPAEAKANHIEGAVVLRALISKEGTVENLQIVSGPKELFVSAIDAVKEWRYRPYVLNGELTEVETIITVNYNLGK